LAFLDTRQAIVEGVIDLAFEEEAGWVVVDFKTDHELAGVPLDTYRRQVTLYAAGISRATGRPATGILLRLQRATLRSLAMGCCTERRYCSSRRSNSKERGSPISIAPKSRCDGFNKKLNSVSMMTLGTFSTAVVPLRSHSSPSI